MVNNMLSAFICWSIPKSTAAKKHEMNGNEMSVQRLLPKENSCHKKELIIEKEEEISNSYFIWKW